jgi:hypothetical protein
MRTKRFFAAIRFCRIAGLTVVLLALTLLPAGCDNGSTSGGGGGGGNSFVGKWRGDDDTMEFTANLTWTWTDDDEPDKTSSGTYAPSGGTAKLTWVSGDEYFKSMTHGQTITINGNSFVLAGLKTFTKVNN